MKKSLIIVAIVIVVAIGTYLVVSKNGPTAAPTGYAPATESMPSAPAPVANTPAAAPENPAPFPATVDIKNFSFDPQTFTVKKGTTVTWTNDDGVAHTVTSDAGNLLDSSTLSPGQSFSFTFADVGSFAYHCNIHRSMSGTIIVE